MTGCVASISLSHLCHRHFGEPTQERACHIRHKAFQAQGNSRNCLELNFTNCLRHSVNCLEPEPQMPVAMNNEKRDR
jgi:hypothetical protein